MLTQRLQERLQETNPRLEARSSTASDIFSIPKNTPTPSTFGASRMLGRTHHKVPKGAAGSQQDEERERQGQHVAQGLVDAFGGVLLDTYKLIVVWSARHIRGV